MRTFFAITAYYEAEAMFTMCVIVVCFQTKGWSKEAKIEFHSLVGSAAVEMRPLGQDTDSLLVDLRKVPMDQSSDVSISVREFLVFIEVARYMCVGGDYLIGITSLI